MFAFPPLPGLMVDLLVHTAYLRIGVPAPDLAALSQRNGASTAALITAYNLFSHPHVSKRTNAHRRAPGVRPSGQTHISVTASNVPEMAGLRSSNMSCASSSTFAGTGAHEPNIWTGSVAFFWLRQPWALSRIVADPL
jgi:hypothetical protein